MGDIDGPAAQGTEPPHDPDGPGGNKGRSLARFLRFLAITLAAAVIGAAIGYIDEQDPVDAVVLATFAVGVVVWVHFKLWRDGELPKAKPVPRRYARWALIGGGVVLAIVVALVGGLAGMQAHYDEAGFLLRDSQVALEPLASLKGIRLGDRLESTAAGTAGYEPDPEAPASAPATRYYRQRSTRLRLRVDDEHITRISYSCAEHDPTRINRVGCNDARRRVLEVFGNGARTLCANVAPGDPNAAKAAHAFAFDVLDTGTRYIVLDGQVKGFVVMDPQVLEDAVGGDTLWHRCR